MGKFIGSFGSYALAVIMIACGIGGLFYFNKQSVEDEDFVQVDITPDNGYNWEKLSDGMFVKLEANNSGGYHVYEYDDNHEPKNRYYLVYNYSQKTNSYDHLICVVVNSYEYKYWDDLCNQVLSPKGYLKTRTVENYVHKMNNSEYKDLRNSMLIEGIDDVDELEKLILPYYIGPKEVPSTNSIFIKYILIGTIVAGLLLLIGSIIGSIVNRY